MPGCAPTHEIIQHAAAFAPIWYVVGDYTKSPYDLINLALVFKAFYRIFTSDHAWRYYDVHSIGRGIMRRFSRDLKNRRKFKSNWKQIDWHCTYQPTYLLLKSLRTESVPYDLIPGTKLWWCFLRLARPRTIRLPQDRTAALELLEWFPNAEITGAENAQRDREFLVKLLDHPSVTGPNFDLLFRSNFQSFQRDKQLMLMAMARWPPFVRFVLPELLQTPEFAVLAQQHTQLLKWVPQNLRDNFEYLMSACNGLSDAARVEEYPRSLELQLCRAQLQQECTYNVIECASPRIRRDPELLGCLLDTTPVVDVKLLAKVIDRKMAVHLWCDRIKSTRGSCQVGDALG